MSRPGFILSVAAVVALCLLGIADRASGGHGGGGHGGGGHAGGGHAGGGHGGWSGHGGSWGGHGGGWGGHGHGWGYWPYGFGLWGWGGGYGGYGGYGGGYYPDYYGGGYPYEYRNGNYADAYDYQSAYPAYDSGAPQSAVEPDAVMLRIHVPGNAALWIDDARTRQTGAVREFVSPPLNAAGDYTYRIRAQWMQDGRPVESSRDVSVRAGDRLMIDMANPRTRAGNAVRPPAAAVPGRR